MVRRDHHRKTKSNSSSNEAKEYRKRQRQLEDEGRLQEAIQMDIDDVKEIAGDEFPMYERGIREMIEYTKALGVWVDD